MMLDLVSRLTHSLNSQGIRYCHWKSNLYLKDALAGDRDLDILVDRKDVQRFESILGSLGFKRAIDPMQAPCPSVFHFYGLDNETGVLVHLHVYYRVITGESLLKNYSFPLEELLLQNPRLVESMPVPQMPAELILFVLRMMAKHASLLEYLLLRRSYGALREELAPLLAEDSAPDCFELLADWLPALESTLFCECVDALKNDTPFPRRFWLAIKLRRQLKIFDRYSSVSRMWRRTTLFLRRVSRRLLGAGKSKQLASGGVVIAFVGPEATGKSTLVSETMSWLGKVFNVRSAHLGKPPATWLTFLPNLALPLLRKAAPQHRMSRVESNPGRDTSRVSLLYSIRSVLVAWDRRALAVRLHREAANGTIAICDRYPSAVVGAMDSARLRISEGKGLRSRLLSYLARLEYSIYRQIPPPDVVVRLTVPVGVAIERNKERQKKDESDAYVLRRHTTSVVPSFPTARTIELDTDQPKSQTVSSVRQILWNVL